MLMTYIILYYPIALPITIYISFWLKLYTKGLWIGFTGAVTILICIFAVFLIRMNYQAQIQSVRKKLKIECNKA